MGTYSPAPAYEHLGDLPPTYGSQSVYLVAYDPRQLFVYWDIDPGHVGNTNYGLRICRGDGEVESEVSINPREAGRYLVTGVPGGTYYVELGTTGRAGRWRLVGFSGRVTMPPAGLAGEVEPKFATLPFHLSFQRLLELIQDAMGQGESLTAALARLQAGDKLGLESLLGTLATLSHEQLQVLERLLGHQVDLREAASSFAGASENFGLALAAGGSQMLSAEAFGQGAGGSSEAFGSETLAWGAAGFGSETLTSGARVFGSESLAAGALSFGSETLSSFGRNESSMHILRGLGINSEAWSLASGGFGVGSESLASGGFGMGSESLAGDRGGHLFRDLDVHLSHLTSMFSWAAASLSSEFLNSESSGSGSGFL